MQYGGNLESENPIFFDSISSAIDASQISRVRLTAGVGEVWGLLGCSLSFDKAFIWENVTYSVDLLYRNILSVYSAASPQSVDCIYHVFPACSLFLPPSLLLQ